MQINFVSFFAGGLFISLILLFLFRVVALKFNLLASRKVPSVGGLAMAVTFVLIIIFGVKYFGGFSREIVGILISSVLMFLFGLLDDWKELSVGTKFFVQIISTGILVLFGVRTQIVQVGLLVNLLITFIWVLGVTNALNHLDVMDGVAGLTAFFVSAAFFSLGFLHGDYKSAILSIALLSGLSGFLFFNLPPAKVYMGNSGSHFLGFVLASIALLISYAPADRKLALLSPILILGFPVYDTLFLIVVRLLKKKVPFKKSNDHLVFRYLTLGLSKERTIIVVIIWNIIFILAGIAVSQTQSSIAGAIIAVVSLLCLLYGIKMGRVCVND